MSEKIIYFDEKVTSFYFCDIFLKKLSEHYKNNGNIKPAISFENVQYIDNLVIPNLILLGIYLRNHHNGAIELKLD